jgi:hypothetical protein
MNRRDFIALATETHVEEIAAAMKQFLATKVA